LQKKLTSQSRTAATTLFDRLDYEVNLTYVRNRTDVDWTL
jgi:hypothetical protein